jgi:uncharacterized protein (TIGR02265 family)
MAGDSAARVKGSIIVSRLRWLRDRGGDALVAKVLSRLPPDEAKRLGEQILHVVWYPLELNLALDEAIAEELSPGDKRKVFLDMGRASADMNLTGPHKAFVKVGDPHALLGMAPQIYRSYYETGRRTYEKTGPKSGVLRTFEAEDGTPADCLTVVGWHVRAIELCGGTEVRVLETKCRSRGDDCCEYRCEWS